LTNDSVINELYAECYYAYRSDIDEQAASILELLPNYFESLENISVLDVGSGPGRLAIPIGRKIQRIVCVEPDISAANHLRSRSEKSKVHVEICTKKIQELSNQNLGYFDLVILSHVIHWFELSSLFEFSAKFVKDGGYILLSFFSLDRLKNMLFYKISGKEVLEIQKKYTPSKLEVKRELSQLGFQIVKNIDIPLNVFYGEGKLENIINSAGTLAWQKLRSKIPEEEYRQIKLQALTRLKNEPSLTDTEYRTMILAKKTRS